MNGLGPIHDPKNLALALSIEAAELNELFLWKKESDLGSVDLDKLKEEIADVFAYAIMLAGRYDLDVTEIVRAKILKMPKNTQSKEPREMRQNTTSLKMQRVKKSGNFDYFGTGKTIM